MLAPIAVKRRTGERRGSRALLVLHHGQIRRAAHDEAYVAHKTAGGNVPVVGAVGDSEAAADAVNAALAKAAADMMKA